MAKVEATHSCPLHPAATATVETFLRCGDLVSGFTCKGRHFCPSCHQRRVRSTSDWMATAANS